MKSLILAALALLSISQALHAQPLVEVKAGYFFFNNAKMRKVYDQGGMDLQVTGTYPVHKKVLSVYGSVEYLQKSGHSTTGQRTHLWEWPISLGLRIEANLKSFMKYYFTIGPRYFFVGARNNPSFVPHHMHANGCGGFVNTGFLFMIAKHFTIDLFGECSYKRLHFHSSKKGTYGETAQVGGLTFGGGVGYLF